MNLDELLSAFEEVVKYHNESSDMFYFGKGSSEGVAACERALKIVKTLRDRVDISKTTAVPNQPLYRVIKTHIDQIRQNYPNNDKKLVYIFLRKLIPGKISPLSFSVLSSLSLCSVIVQVNNEKFAPETITAYIDGYYNFVVPVGGNIIRIPLINPNGKTPVSLPPSIRFLGKGEDKRIIQEQIIGKAATHGRYVQLHSFISILSRSNPKLGPHIAFRDALCSFDLSFPTALAALASGENAKHLITYLANVLGCHGVIDHFIRVLATASRVVVTANTTEDSIEFTTLANMFLSSSFDWIDDLTAHQDINFDDLLRILCFDKLKDLPNLSLYVLRCALVIACYHDARGDAAVAMFMEVYIRAFARKFYLENQYMEEKELMLRHSPDVQENAEIIQHAIVEVLGLDIGVKFTPKRIQRQLHDLYNFVVTNADQFVRLVICMNSRPKDVNPVLQSMIFAYNISQDYEDK